MPAVGKSRNSARAVTASEALAQDRLPSSTNPAERIVYRGELAADAQQAMQLTCYGWSSDQTRWDPEVSFAELERQHERNLVQIRLNPRQGG